MKTCTDPKIGNLILSYELGQLSQDEMEQFEQHLFECTSCADDVFDDIPFVTVLKTAIQEYTATAKIINMTQVKHYTRAQLDTLQQALQTTIETLRQRPTHKFVYAEAENGEIQPELEAVVKDLQGNLVGQTMITILNAPRIEQGVFTIELEIPEARYTGCKMSVGIKLSAADMLIETEPETIPADGMLFIREEMGIEGAMTLHPDMLVVTIFE